MTNSNTKIAGIKWRKDPIKYLGIYIGTNKNDCDKLNWYSKLEAFQKLLDCWKSKHLTIYSKISFLKTYALSKTIYSALNLPIPNGFIKEIETKIFNFILGKKDKIRRRSLICDHVDGGLNMIDIESHFHALKASWMNRIIAQTKPWNILAKNYFKTVAPENVILSFSLEKNTDLDILSDIPKFYQEVIVGFSKSKKSDSIITKQQLFDQIIWGNKNLIFNRKCLYSKHFINANIFFVSDILNQNGNIRNDVYTRLINKTTYYQDLSAITQSLIPYKTIRFSNIRIDRNIVVDSKIYVYKKSKQYYQQIKIKKQLPPISINFWKNEFQDFNFKQIYENKIKKLYISPIKEFMYKIYHNICVCNYLLHKWKKARTDRCPYCIGYRHTVKHMIWQCNMVKPVWTKLGHILQKDMTYRLLIFGEFDKNVNNLISFVMFCIYKKFIIENQDNQLRPFISCYTFVKQELKKKSEIYESDNNLLELSQLLRNIYEQF